MMDCEWWGLFGWQSSRCSQLNDALELDGLQLITFHLDFEHRPSLNERHLFLDGSPYCHEALHLLKYRSSLKPRREEKADMACCRFHGQQAKVKFFWTGVRRFVCMQCTAHGLLLNPLPTFPSVLHNGRHPFNPAELMQHLRGPRHAHSLHRK